MKEVILKIPDKKLDFFLELFRHLGIEVSPKSEIPEEHKTVVRERINNAKPEDMILWNEARQQLKIKRKP